MKFKIGDYVKVNLEWHLGHNSLGVISKIEGHNNYVDIMVKANKLYPHSDIVLLSERLILANEKETYLMDRLVTFK